RPGRWEGRGADAGHLREGVSTCRPLPGDRPLQDVPLPRGREPLSERGAARGVPGDARARARRGGPSRGDAGSRGSGARPCRRGARAGGDGVGRPPAPERARAHRLRPLPGRGNVGPRHRRGALGERGGGEKSHPPRDPVGRPSGGGMAVRGPEPREERGMSCTVEEELTAYLDGELSVVEAARVRTHLASCADCRATEALLRRTVTELAALPAFEPSAGLRRRVLAEVEALPRPWPERLREWFRPALLAPAGVAVVTAVVVAVVAGQRVVAERAE